VWNLRAKCKLVETERQGLFERLKSLPTIAWQTNVDVLRGSCAISEPKLKRGTAFEMIVAYYALIDRALQYTTEREKRDPTPQAQFIHVRFSSDAIESLIKSFTPHALDCSSRLKGGRHPPQ
jgi:hypothetical protein